MHEHKLAVRQAAELSQMAVPTYELDHEFNFAAAKIIAQAGNKTCRELIEARASIENLFNGFIGLARRTEPCAAAFILVPSISNWLECPTVVACSVIVTISDDGLLHMYGSSDQ
ncbi:hypothetical protein SprV_0100164700 [Sparganum proliferum]